MQILYIIKQDILSIYKLLPLYIDNTATTTPKNREEKEKILEVYITNVILKHLLYKNRIKQRIPEIV